MRRSTRASVWFAIVGTVMVMFQNCGSPYLPVGTKGDESIGSNAQYAVAAVESVPALANGVDPLIIRIEIRDNNGQLAAGQTPDFSVTGVFALRSACSASNASGISTCEITSTVAGERELRTIRPSVVVTTVRFLPGAPSTITVLAGAGQSANTGTALMIPPRVRISDAFNNVISGISVGFLPSADGRVQNASVTTDAGGEATSGAWTLSTTAGANTLRVTAGTATLNISATGLMPDTNPTRVVLFPQGTCSTNRLEVFVNNSPHPQFQFVNGGECIRMPDNVATSTLRVRCIDPASVFAPSDFVGPGALSAVQNLNRCSRIYGT